MNLNNCSTCSNDDCCSECMETNSVIDGLNRFDFCDALKLPFLCPPPFFRLTMSHKALFATQEIPPDSTEFVVINNYLQLTCNDKSNLTDCEKIRIYRYQRLSDIVPELGHPNWLLWTGVRGDNLESIKWEGLQLGKPKNALFFTTSFAMALQFTDVKEIKWESRAQQSKGEPFSVPNYQDQPLYVLLCKVALGKPFFAKRRRVRMPIEDLDSSEIAYRNWRLHKIPGAFKKSFPVTRYQTMAESFENENYKTVEQMIELATDEDSNSVVVCNSSFEPDTATLWKGRVLPNAILVNREGLVDADGKNFIDCENNHAYGEAFVWDTTQVAIRYIVEFKADRIGYLEKTALQEFKNF